MKRLICFVCMITLIFTSMICVPVSAQTELEVVSVTYTLGEGAAAIDIDEPEPGFVTTNASITGASGQKARLIVATYESSKKLSAANIVSGTVNSEGTLLLSAGVQMKKGETYRYFVWNGDKYMTPVETILYAPSDIRVLKATTHSMIIGWEKPDNSSAVKGYNVYRDGALLGSTTEEYYVDYGLDAETQYTYSVCSFDKNNVESLKISTPLKGKVGELPTCNLRNSSDYYYHDGGDSYDWSKRHVNGLVYFKRDGLTNLSGADANIGGKDCRMHAILDSGSYKAKFAAFAIDQSYVAAKGNPTKYTVSVEYYDNGTTPVTVQYSASGSTTHVTGGSWKSKSKVAFTRTNTNTWKTATFDIEEADLRWTMTNKCDNIWLTSNDTFYISKVIIAETNDFKAGYQINSGVVSTAKAPMFSDALGKNAGLTYTENTTTTADHFSTIETFDGIKARFQPHFVADGKNKVSGGWFAIDQEYYQQSESNVYTLEFDYYVNSDVAGRTAVVQYGASIKSVPVNVVNKQWSSATVTLPNFDGANLAGDKRGTFRIQLGGAFVEGDGIAITNVKLFRADEYVSKDVTKKLQKATISLADGNVEGSGLILGTPGPSADGYTESATIGGESCRVGVYETPERTVDRCFYFKVDDEFMYGKVYNSAVIEVEYFDIGWGPIYLEYNSSDTTLGWDVENKVYDIAFKRVPLVIERNNSNTWRKATVTIEDACFVNAQARSDYASHPFYPGDFKTVSNISADFRVRSSSQNTEPLYIKGATVKFGRFPVIEKPAEPEIEEINVFVLSDTQAADSTDGVSTGWGKTFTNYASEYLVIDNYSAVGKSSADYIASEYLAEIEQTAKEGDVALIQLGYDDYKDGVVTSAYTNNLTQIVNDLKDIGVNPVFVTPFIVNNVTIDAAVEPYRTAMREAAHTLDVPLVDVATGHKAFLDMIGDDIAYHYADDVKFTKRGADKAAEILAETIDLGEGELLDNLSEVGFLAPFNKYIYGDAPEIVRELGTTTTSNGATIRKVVFHSRNVNGSAENCYAIIGIPAGTGPFPAILNIHGGSGYASESFVTSWTARGYVTMAFDEPGIADASKCPYSTGAWKYNNNRYTASPNVEKSTIYSAVVSMINAFNLLTSLEQVDTENVGITGASWGGYGTTMLASLMGDRVKAAYAHYGCGFYDIGSSFWPLATSAMKDEQQQQRWLYHLDNGRKVERMTANYVLGSPTNDTFFWPLAQAETYSRVYSNKRQQYAANLFHAAEVDMTLPFMEYHLKGIGSDFHKVEIVSEVSNSDGTKTITFKSDSKNTLTKGSLYYSISGDWGKEVTTSGSRTWTEVKGTYAGNNTYTAVLPAAAASSDTAYWFANITDSANVCISTILRKAK